MSAARFAIVTTAYGAYALHDAQSGEVMHPGRGPLHEAEALYVAPGRLTARLAEASPDALVLLDVGLGAGSNAVAALRAAERAPSCVRRLEIISFDLSTAALQHVLDSEQRAAFGFSSELEGAARALLADGYYESPRVSWRFVCGDALEALARLPAGSADLVFWDPYSPRSDGRLWSEAAFSELRRVCRAGATVHTYSAATATRSALLLSGFYVGFGPAIGDKQRHATFAATLRADLERPLDRSWLVGLSRSLAAVPESGSLSREARARLATCPQFAE